MALFSMKTEILLSLSCGKSTTLMLLNLLTAFGTMEYSTLLSCLSSSCGLSGSVTKWFEFYLIDLYKSVKNDSTLFSDFSSGSASLNMFKMYARLAFLQLRYFTRVR